VPRIMPKIIFFLLFSALITVLQLIVNVKLDIPLSLVLAMGLTVSLLLVFRTNTAYDRYWEGRRLWSAAVTQVRTLVRLLWIGVKEQDESDKLEKKKAVNLLIAFVIATKHYLREEYGTDYDDLYDLIDHLPRYRAESVSKSSKRHIDFNLAIQSNLPLEITIVLSAYINHQNKKGNLGPSRFQSLLMGMANLTDVLTNLERVLHSPIPLAYSIHLSQSVWLFCLGLPFQLVGSMKWVTIPITVVTAMTLFGIESIGGEIENPFGFDANDLPLDDFCQVLRLEMERVITQDTAHPLDWIFSDANLDFIRDQNIRTQLKAESEKKMRVQRVKELEKRSTSDETPAIFDVVVEEGDGKRLL